MSYPYQQGSHQGMPGMPPYPQNNAPYPPQSFNQNAPYPTQFNTGYDYNTPTQMPRPMGYPPTGPPMGGMPQYPNMGGSPQGPPPMGGAYPGNYPSGSPSSYPPPSSNPPYGGAPPSGYPPYGGQAPPTGNYPPAQNPPYGAPPSSGAQPTSNYPPSGPYGSAPPFGGSAPPSGAAPPFGGAPPAGNYPPQGGYPPQGAYPPQGGYPSQGGGMPNSGSLYPDIHKQASHYGNLGNAPESRIVKYSPTVLPAEPFDPRADAETLRKAMKGFGTDEKAIIAVLANRTNAQRLEIGVQFKTLYGKDLIKDLKSELSGNFENLVVAMMTPLPQFYAKEIKDALDGVGTDEDVLIEVMCTMNNNELRIIRAAYETMYHSSLESDLAGDTSGTFKRLLVSLCTANRDESMQIDHSCVQTDAQALLRAGEMRLGTDESTFNAILCQRNYAHLQAVFEEYQRVTGHDFEKAIKNEFSGDAEEGMLAIVRSIKNRAEFFAKRLNQSMKGMGTNDRQLIRLVVTRSEVDMGNIKEAYQAKYGKSLADDISSDCSGDYKKCLLALITI